MLLLAGAGDCALGPAGHLGGERGDPPGGGNLPRVQVSSDWSRAGHVTIVLTSDWSRDQIIALMDRAGYSLVSWAAEERTKDDLFVRRDVMSNTSAKEEL